MAQFIPRWKVIKTLWSAFCSPGWRDQSAYGRFKPEHSLSAVIECSLTMLSAWGELPILPVRGDGVYTPDIPCTGWWSLYSRYSLYRVVEFILPILPVQGRGACSLANTRFCWSSGANALPVTTIGFSGIRTYNSLAANHYFWITYGHSWVFVTNASYSLIGNRVCFKWHIETGYNV